MHGAMAVPWVVESQADLGGKVHLLIHSPVNTPDKGRFARSYRSYEDDIFFVCKNVMLRGKTLLHT